MFRQTGGLHTADYLTVTTQADYLTVTSQSEQAGCYELAGGTLQINAGWYLGGTLDCAGGNAVITAAGALVDLSKGTILDAGSTSLTLGPGSLLVVSAGFDPAAVFGEYASAGMAHTLGETLVIGAGEGFSGWGDIEDFVETAGTITATPGGWVHLNGGASITGGAVDLGGGRLSVDSPGSGIADATLSAEYLWIGLHGAGTFTQDAGSQVEVSSILVGSRDFPGTYRLLGGSLTVGEVDLYGVGGTFIQTGGTRTVTGHLVVWGGGYHLDGGSLVAEKASVWGRFEIGDNLAHFGLGWGLWLYSAARFDAVPGSVVHMTGAAGSAFKNYATDEAALAGLENLTMVFEGGTAAWSTFEVAGRDLGAVAGGFQENFLLGSLEVGGVDAAMVRLEDLLDNGNRSSPEALYLHDLAIGPGSTLDLGGLNVYCDGTYVNQGTILGGAPVVVPEPGTLALLAVGGLALLVRRRRG